MRVLIAVDGSSGGFEAVRQTAALLSGQRDQVALYYSPPEIHLDSGAPEDATLLERARRALAEAVFEEAKAQLPGDLRATAEVILGTQRAAHGITVAAESWKAGLIAVGARGLGPIQRMLVGSVSRSVVHEATMPVLVARPRRHPDQNFKVLLAAETAAGCERLGQILGQFTWPPGTVGRTVSVVSSMFAGEVPSWLEERARSADAEAMSRAWVLEHEAEIKAKTDEMTRCSRNLPPPFRGPAPIVAEGHPADKILEAAASEQADLIVVGARTLGAVSRLLLGSTSEAILSQAACSVLVVREPETP